MGARRLWSTGYVRRVMVGERPIPTKLVGCFRGTRLTGRAMLGDRTNLCGLGVTLRQKPRLTDSFGVNMVWTNGM